MKSTNLAYLFGDVKTYEGSIHSFWIGDVAAGFCHVHEVCRWFTVLFGRAGSIFDLYWPKTQISM